MSLPTRAQMETIADFAAWKGLAGDIVDFTSGLLGGGPTVELTITGGSVDAKDGTPYLPTPRVTIDTESDAASDTLDTITVDEFEDGQYILVGLENAARVVTLTDSDGGVGQMLMSDGLDLVLWKTTQWVLFYVDISGTAFLREVARFGFENGADVTAKTASYTILDQENGATFTNEGAAGAITLTLPTPRPGLRVGVFIAAAQTVNVVPPAVESVYLDGTESTTGWWANAVGEYVEFVGIDSTTWLARSPAGTWTAV